MIFVRTAQWFLKIRRTVVFMPQREIGSGRETRRRRRKGMLLSAAPKSENPIHGERDGLWGLAKVAYQIWDMVSITWSISKNKDFGLDRFRVC